MFESLPPSAWVAAAWLQLALAYGGYWLYLRARRARIDRPDRGGS